MASHVHLLRRLLPLCLLGLSLGAQAFTVTALSPQGEVAQVRQVVAKFSEDVVNFGDPRATAPLSIRCDAASASRGQGRWTSAREWVHDFEADLPPGVRCRAEAAPGFRALGGQPWQGQTSFDFHTGGPYAQRIVPSTWQAIEEEQAFVLRLNGAATPESIQASVWCAIDGLGERVPIRAIEGETRSQLLKAIGLDKAAAKEPLRFAVFSCNRRLTPATQVQIVYGKGVATPSGLANQLEQRFAFRVREPFTASMSCERENAQTACMPIRPITLDFSAPVPRQLAEQVRLRSDTAEHAPVLEAELAADALLERLSFPVPLPERTSFSLSLPAGLQDDSGRALANAASFPLKVTTGPIPPLAKFAAAPFGIVERFAEGPGGPALLPVTLRRVEPQLQAQALQISQLQPHSDADIVAWFNRVQRYSQWLVDREQASKDVQTLPAPIDEQSKGWVESRTLSLLAGQPAVSRIELPPPPSGTSDSGAEQPFEVVGIPLTPGFHVLELSSPRLGQALLDEKYGTGRTMVVRTSALVTNLGVHFKLGRENALAWVTTLDQGQPVAGASVRVSDCRGKEVARASTDAQGIARFDGIPPQAPRCDDDEYYSDTQQAWFVSARAENQGVQDLAFTWSSWQKGIEPWRFNVNTSLDPQPDTRAHTVFDRTLLRAGETVSMKHLLRTEIGAGFGLPRTSPATLVITHLGSGQEYTQPLHWRSTPTGGRSAESSFAIPRSARLGAYAVSLRAARPDGRSQNQDEDQDDDAYLPSFDAGAFRVEEFRLPVLQGRIGPDGPEPLIAATSVPVQVQVGYVSGGPATGLPVRVSALARNKWLHFADYEDFSFAAPQEGRQPIDDSGEEEAAASQDQRVVADKLAATLDGSGLAKVVIGELKAAPQPQDLDIEASFADPNGEIVTLHGRTTLWPAAVIAGIKTEGWVSASHTVKLQALALDLAGQPAAGVPLQVKAAARITTSSRKRMVGGFYTYDNRTETRDLGTVCTGTSDARGLLVCDARLTQPGEIELVVTARDGQARQAQAASSVWVTQQGELWFGGDNHDRMDLLAEKKVYQPGETARFQVRMPFRQATALVAVEREGIVQTQVVQLRGDDPTISLTVDAAWGPNVYVSVLALRGRLREVPWYSFFTWGYKAPREWWHAFWHERGDYVAATPLVDLSKPAFRLGMAEIRVASQAHELAVQVKADQDSYRVRGTARVTISAQRPDGQPAAHAEVAVAAVDQALLELMPNDSWKLLDAMLQRRAWGVETSTAQMEIVGRRHYGRKAVPSGGDGGRGSATRELLDTLLLWRPSVQLDAQGQAQVEVPLNDALTTFQIVAVADMGTGLFGTGQTTIRATQDLQIISGLPPLVREGDAFRAMLTLRNTTSEPMKVELTPRATLLDLKPQTIDIPAGEARETHWDVTAPPQPAHTRAEALIWEIEARDQTSGARDALKISQRIVPAVPLRVQQATLVQLDGAYTLDVAPPADALPTSAEQADGDRRGGIQIALQPKLADGLPGVRDWFARYPYSCLEQVVSKSIGLRDDTLWQQTMAQLPAYLDSDGLAYYFPPQHAGSAHGSDSLTAWMLAATHEAGQLRPAFTLPDDARAQMIAGLTAFVEGRIERRHWSPRGDLDVRKLAAIEALSRHGAARPAMLSSVTIAPNQWPTHALIDWINVLRRVPGIPEQATRRAEAEQILRARLSTQGTRLTFSTERDDHWWWLMAGGDVNAARLLLTVLDEPAWQDDLGRLVTGLIGRQQRGTWGTTTANLWGGLALERFSKAHEATPVAGFTLARLGAASGAVDWTKLTRPTSADPQGATDAAHAARGFRMPTAPGMLTHNQLLLPWGSGPDTLSVTHEGSGKPWLTVQSLAAIELKAPFAAGYQIRKTITPVEQADKSLPAGQYSRGDILRVTLDVTAASDMTWVALSDPVPAGATILGSGLGRDSAIATLGEKLGRTTWPVFEERSFEAFRAYYDYLPKGSAKVEYTMRLNNAGSFQLPPSRVEALYAPEMFGETPNARVMVK